MNIKMAKAMFEWQRVINPMLYGVAFTPKQEGSVSKAILAFANRHDICELFYDLSVCERINQDGKVVECWTERKADKYRLTLSDYCDLIIRISARVYT